MSRVVRDAHRRRLAKMLGAAPDEQFLDLVWATDALQSGREDSAFSILGYTAPEEAATSDIASKHAIRRWELETLSNEVLTSQKSPIRRGPQTKTLNCNNFASIRDAVNL